ncbi:hypothetical protein NDU88_004936 [Pleurodeles waltl]|uniref:Uncharacterized protein n=1 Tax=Pleurodeles waltl TaxID=8319 RepID=A0AAV7M7R3_PLEWA|nr:hypothetical protein NDU88_004936 [Pleurodeles waltl]
MQHMPRPVPGRTTAGRLSRRLACPCEPQYTAGPLHPGTQGRTGHTSPLPPPLTGVPSAGSRHQNGCPASEAKTHGTRLRSRPPGPYLFCLPLCRQPLDPALQRAPPGPSVCRQLLGRSKRPAPPKSAPANSERGPGPGGPGAAVPTRPWAPVRLLFRATAPSRRSPLLRGTWISKDPGSLCC